MGDYVQFLLTKDGITLIGGILALIPMTVLAIFYHHTHQKDYLFFSGVFFAGSISSIANAFSYTNSVFIFILANSTFMLAWLFLMIHSLRYKWKKPPKLLIAIGVIYYIVVQLLLFFYETVESTETAKVLFFEMRNLQYSSVYENGAATVINGDIYLIGSNYYFLGDGFRLFTSILYLYVLLTTNLAHSTRNTQVFRFLLICVASLNGIYSVIALGHSLSLWDTSILLLYVINIIELTILTIIAIRYPEALILTHIQLSRASQLYKFAQTPSDGKMLDNTLERLRNYLNNLPEELVSLIKLQELQKNM